MASTGTITGVFNSERNWTVSITGLTAGAGNVTPSFLSRGFVIGSWSLTGFTSTISVQLTGSNDGTNFFNLGTAVTAAGVYTLTGVTNLVPIYYQFAVTTGTGTGAIIASMMSTFG
jgi:hypothetical protein